uniref:probable phospholipid-transporting ATPase 7 n=1 Tax=Erigeron canadensis TaxID=72917 RepID=UPI001CB8ADF6|nr:probable phospholipid-transporting ATPase 7 [Erigeron canadensis]
MGKRGIRAKLLRSSLYTLANIRTKPSYKKGEATAELSGYPRVIHVNQPTLPPDDTPPPIFCSNYVSTTKYTFFNFLPIALFEQFNRVANFYFLVAACLTFTDYAPFEWPSQVVPLALVVGFSLAKELYEDLQRYWQDKAANCRKAMVHVGNGVFESKQWREVCVGDICKVEKDEFFPADLLLLQSSYEDGMSYVETMNLDGETNLKVKRALQNLSFPVVDGDTATHFRDFRAMIRCENPNSNLYTFMGNLEHDDRIYPLDPAQLLLRDSKLRNTEYVYGVVVFTGNDTKVMQNTTQSPSKRSKIELQMDKIIYLLFGLLIFISIVSASGFGLFVRNTVPFWWYLMPDVAGEDFDINNFFISGLRHLVTALMLYGYLVPISLYVSIEAVKILQARFINNDLHLYDEVSGVPANARTSNLNEQLGQVDTILSDKTGTLTCNQMDFLKCSIAGCPYGKRLSEVELAAAKQLAAELESNDSESSDGNFSDTSSLEAITITDDGNTDKKETIKGFSFQDDRLQNGNWLKEPNAEVILLFFRILAVCHSAIPEVNEKTGELTYEAESPDEGAFLVAAREFGFQFIKRTQNSVVVREKLSKDQEPVEKEYNILTLLDFTSKRKRMSVIMRDETGQIFMLCKGADTIIFDRLASNGKMFLEATTKNLNDYGEAGLRTLALAYKKLEETEYTTWYEKFHNAQISSGPNREELLEELSDTMERGLTLVGATAVEDKLQNGVPECIDRLALAGLKIWVLTGDKMETAINIGFSCSLLRQGMTQICIVVSAEMLAQDAKNVVKENILSQITKATETVKGKKDSRAAFALIIDGKTLTYALEDDMKFKFLNLAVNCASVICCRVSPKQKALVVRLVKEGTGKTTLGIGDGANDVGMIKEADIGIGISGVEGMQAVMASDFSIAQFRFLERLLIVHGHWCYKRISKMICYFFYKNITLALTLFYFEAETGFSGQMHYDDWYMLLYNVFLTSCPVLALGVLEKDICAEFCLQFPALYQQGPKNLFFDWYRIIGWLANGVYASFVIYLVNLKIFSPESFRQEGQTADMHVIGTAMFTSIIWVVNVQVFLISHYLTRIQLHTIWGSIVVWYLIVYVYGMLPVKWSSGNIYHQLPEVLGPAHKFYLSTVFVTLLCNMPYLIHISYQRCYNPEDHHVLQEMKNLRKDVTDRKMWKREQCKAKQETEIGVSARVDAKLRNMKGRVTRKYSSLAFSSS